MVLYYNNYCNLLSAIDEHTQMKYPKHVIQDMIYDHFMNKYGSFIAYNSKKAAQLFTSKINDSIKGKSRKRHVFRNFMNK